MTLSVYSINLHGMADHDLPAFLGAVMSRRPDVCCLQGSGSQVSRAATLISGAAPSPVQVRLAKEKEEDSVAVVPLGPPCARGRAEGEGGPAGVQGTGWVQGTDWVQADLISPQGYGITMVSLSVPGPDGLSPSEVPVHPAGSPRADFLARAQDRLRLLQTEAAGGGRQAVVCGGFDMVHTALDQGGPEAVSTGGSAVASQLEGDRSGLSADSSPARRPAREREEAAWMDRVFEEDEFVDVVRDMAGPVPGLYTAWQGGRGRRVDAQCVTPELAWSATGFLLIPPGFGRKAWRGHAAVGVTYEV